MRRLLKRLLVLASILLFALLVFSLATFTLYKSTPTWYSTPIPQDHLPRLAQQAETKITETQNWATLLHGDAIRSHVASQSSHPAPTTRVTDTHDIHFTQDELNALFEKWSALYRWQSSYAQYLDNPRIILQTDRLILAATIKELGAVTSFHFAPRLDDRNQLRLDLVKVMGGRLPLPQPLWSAQKHRVTGTLKSRIPTWQPTARIDPTGAANDPAMLITLSRLVMCAANNQPADPILFLPLTDPARSVPVKITALTLAPASLTLRVQKLTPTERAALLAKIQQRPIE